MFVKAFQNSHVKHVVEFLLRASARSPDFGTRGGLDLGPRCPHIALISSGPLTNPNVRRTAADIRQTCQKCSGEVLSILGDFTYTYCSYTHYTSWYPYRNSVNVNKVSCTEEPIEDRDGYNQGFLCSKCDDTFPDCHLSNFLSNLIAEGS
jgi:hypothetical protein